ncbi:MAG: hypothetical protein BGN86_01915 [Caulobacterales bacterium 68-7]|nr:response regulator [Caulobacterales bacterium]OJU12966.1 MAG: hypothetical protein BGN86_01915 [Caulobacterales bacterium 68-7]
MNERSPRILIVDDDPELRGQISNYLSEKGFLVSVATDGPTMDACMSRETIDLVVLDLGLPGESGISICQRVSRKGTPIIMASAAGEEADRVMGLELGADDYLAKPFSPRELLARVRAVLRRQEISGANRGALFHFAGFIYDPVRRHLIAGDGAQIPLTGGESSILGALLINAGRAMTREELLSASQNDTFPDSRSIDLQISRLRRKLSLYGRDDLISTQRGLGYSLGCDVLRK